MQPPPPTNVNAIALALACAFLSGATVGVRVLDFGAHVDGVGIGLEWSRPLGHEYGLRAGVVLAASLVQSGLSLVAFRRARGRPFGVVKLCGIAFVGWIAGFVGAGKALPAWGKLGCDRGNAYACCAAGGVTDGAVARALADRACAGDVGSACRRIVQQDELCPPLVPPSP